MHRYRALVVSLLMLSALAPNAVRAQGRPDSAALLAAQRQAMLPLAFMDGVWRGPAATVMGDGTRHEVTQTERIGPFLDGSVKVIEGRGYGADGKVAFNAFGIISFDSGTRKYSLRSYAMGLAGDFAFTPSDSGYVWEIPAGPATIRYTCTVKAGHWREVGQRLVPGQEPTPFFEMNLVRVRDTDWPAAGAVSAQ